MCVSVVCPKELHVRCARNICPEVPNLGILFTIIYYYHDIMDLTIIYYGRSHSLAFDYRNRSLCQYTKISIEASQLKRETGQFCFYHLTSLIFSG